MKKILMLVIIFSVGCSGNCYAFFSLPSLKLFNKKTTEIQTELSAVKVGQATANTDISAIKSTVGEIKTTVGNIEMKATAQGNAVVGLKNEIQQTNSDMKAGRDVNVNDSALMQFIVEKWAWVVGSLLGMFGAFLTAIFGLFKWQGYMYERLLQARDEHISNLQKSADKKDDKIDNWMMLKIDKQNGNKNPS